MPAETPRVVRLTPPGRGAIASLAIEGPEVGRLLDRLFRSPHDRRPSTLAPGDLAFGRWVGPDSPATGPFGDPAEEEVVLARLSANRYELHCHGGQAATARVLADLAQVGVPSIDWTVACQSEKADPLVTEARLAFSQARTAATARRLWDQVEGALSRAIQTAIRAARASQTDSAKAVLGPLLEQATFGRHLTQPWRVVLWGPPNVGKSSLLNALAGYERAIVFPQPGTTRDVVRLELALEGWPLEICDTAGYRATGDPLEAQGIARSKSAAQSADLVVWVEQLPAGGPPLDVAGNHSTRPADAGLALPALPEERLLRVGSKADLVTISAGAPHDAGDWLRTSAVTGQGLEELAGTIIRRLVGQAPPRGTPLVFTNRQQAAVERALAELEAGRLDRSASELERLLPQQC